MRQFDQFDSSFSSTCLLLVLEVMLHLTVYECESVCVSV